MLGLENKTCLDEHMNYQRKLASEESMTQFSTLLFHLFQNSSSNKWFTYILVYDNIFRYMAN